MINFIEYVHLKLFLHLIFESFIESGYKHTIE